MSFTISERSLTCGQREHRALIVTPTRPMVLGRARLEALRKPPRMSEVDRRLVSECAVRRGRVHVAILRGVDVLGHPGWSFDPELNAVELEEMGYLLTRALLPVHRRMMAAGLSALVHSDWGEREYIAIRQGVSTLAAELSRKPVAGATERADLWILRNMLFHFSLPLERIVESVLPGHLRIIEGRAARTRELIEQLPPDAVD